LKIKFLGATGTVTGSNYYIESNGYKFLVDCGQFQGSAHESKMNFTPFNFEPSEIDFVLLTHSHIDHSGRIPKLIKDGFRGKILCTRPTTDITTVLLKDSAKIHELDCEAENRKRERAGLDRIEPLYTLEDAELAICYLYPVDYNKTIILNDSINVVYKEAGHLLGSSFVQVEITEGNETKNIVFSGDLGTGKNEMLKPLEYPEDADYIVMESTYGTRVHEHLELRYEKLLSVIIETIDNGGTVLIPSFAAGRTQEIIYGVKHLITDESMKDRFSKIQFYADSPLAINITDIYIKNKDYLSEELQRLFNADTNPIDFPNLKFVNDMNDSIGLNHNPNPKVIISASGMCDAGRIKHHLKHYLWRPETTIIFIGYQAEESIGRQIQEGHEHVDLFNENIKINAKVVTLAGFSGHADMNTLRDWLSKLKNPPKKVFITHGEEASRTNLKKLIVDKYDYDVVIPALNEEIEL